MLLTKIIYLVLGKIVFKDLTTTQPHKTITIEKICYGLNLLKKPIYIMDII